MILGPNVTMSCKPGPENAYGSSRSSKWECLSVFKDIIIGDVDMNAKSAG